MPHRRRLRPVCFACTAHTSAGVSWTFPPVQARSSDDFLLTPAFDYQPYVHRRQLCMTMCITTSTSHSCSPTL